MSDWALGKKLNSRVADVPINHLIWLNDYKTYGENSYVFRDKGIWNELCNTEFAWKDKTFITLAEPNMYTEHINDVTGYMKYNIGLADYSFDGNFYALLGNADFVRYIITKYSAGEENVKQVFDFVYTTSKLKEKYLNCISEFGEYHKLEQTFKENSYDNGAATRTIGGFTYNVSENKVVIVKSLVRGHISPAQSGEATKYADITADGKAISTQAYPIKCSKIASNDLTVKTFGGFSSWSHGYIEFYEI